MGKLEQQARFMPVLHVNPAHGVNINLVYPVGLLFVVLGAGCTRLTTEHVLLHSLCIYYMHVLLSYVLQGPLTMLRQGHTTKLAKLALNSLCSPGKP